jgi:CBS domain-containing protein
MSPRAAWRLESLGFGEVYDYVAGKLDWLGAGLPVEGSTADTTRLLDLADPDVATCDLDDPVGEVRRRIRDSGVCLAVNAERVVLGLVRSEDLGGDDARRASEVMQEGPSTHRPHLTAKEMASRLERHPASRVIVTTSAGRLVGVVLAKDIEAAAGGGPG